MNSDPGHWVGRLTGWCFSILAAAAALWCAVKLLCAMWPTLATIVGIATLFIIIVRVVVHYTSQKY
jgi:hypothetical protein